MNNFYSSEAIFEVIGNYPVVDQFDISYSGLHEGSYVDNYVTGAMFYLAPGVTTIGNTKISFIQGDRRLAFSKLDVDRTSAPGRKYQTFSSGLAETFQSYNEQFWYERAGTIRVVKHFSPDERYLDSLMPDISKMIKNCNGTIHEYFFSAGLKTPVIALGKYHDGSYSLGADGFNASFPFEPKFADIERRKKLSDGFSINKSYNASSRTESNISQLTVRKVAIVDYTRLTSPASSFVYEGIKWSGYYDPNTSGRVPREVETFDAAKILFGFGDGRIQDINPYGLNDGTVPRQNLTGSQGPMWRWIYSAATNNYKVAVSPLIRGWKYGVHDGNPHYTSCVFRRDKFGQFRDMLEQRLCPVTYLDDSNAPLRDFGVFEKPPIPKNVTRQVKKPVTIEYPVTVKFVKQLVLETNGLENLLYAPQSDPTLTWSSNLSLYATSSLPFFDANNDSDGKNRSAIPDAVLNPEGVFITI